MTIVLASTTESQASLEEAIRPGDSWREKPGDATPTNGAEPESVPLDQLPAKDFNKVRDAQEQEAKTQRENPEGRKPKSRAQRAIDKLTRRNHELAAQLAKARELSEPRRMVLTSTSDTSDNMRAALRPGDEWKQPPDATEADASANPDSAQQGSDAAGQHADESFALVAAEDNDRSPAALARRAAYSEQVQSLPDFDRVVGGSDAVIPVEIGKFILGAKIARS